MNNTLKDHADTIYGDIMVQESMMDKQQSNGMVSNNMA